MSALGYTAQWDAAVPGLVHLTTPVLPAVWEGSDKSGLGGPGRALLLSGVAAAEGSGGLAALLAPAPGKRRSFFNQLIAQVRRTRRDVMCRASAHSPPSTSPFTQVLGNAAEFEKQRAAAEPASAAAAAAGDGTPAPPTPAYVTFGDGSPMPVEPLLTAAAAADAWGVDVEASRGLERAEGWREQRDGPSSLPPPPLSLCVQWQQGDVVLLDNTSVMHARRCVGGALQERSPGCAGRLRILQVACVVGRCAGPLYCVSGLCNTTLPSLAGHGLAMDRVASWPRLPSTGLPQVRLDAHHADEVARSRSRVITCHIPTTVVAPL